MTDNEILERFRAAGALLEGHFVLSSGLHSPHYLQCARVLTDPHIAGELAVELVQKLPADQRRLIDVVVSPAMGGIIIGQEVGRALRRRHMFLERPTGVFEFRRGFELRPGENVLLVEDVVTTGMSSGEAIDVIEASGENKVIAISSLVDRSGGDLEFEVPFYPLLRLDVPLYREADLPPQLAAIPVTKPGSRK